MEVGDEVKAGDVIGYSGSSGATVGGALLFEIRMDGKAENPWNYFYLPNDGYQKALDEISKDYTDGGIAGIYNEDGTPVFLISNPALRNSIENFEFFLIFLKKHLTNDFLCGKLIKLSHTDGKCRKERK